MEGEIGKIINMPSDILTTNTSFSIEYFAVPDYLIAIALKRTIKDDKFNI